MSLITRISLFLTITLSPSREVARVWQILLQVDLGQWLCENQSAFGDSRTERFHGTDDTASAADLRKAPSDKRFVC
jgi:hypothetical protein